MTGILFTKDDDTMDTIYRRIHYMVKGITRQVIVVKSPDKKLFDQAIFLVREDALANGGITEEALLNEARIISK